VPSIVITPLCKLLVHGYLSETHSALQVERYHPRPTCSHFEPPQQPEQFTG
jgi:hypothetical protein